MSGASARRRPRSRAATISGASGSRLPAPGNWAIFDRTWYGRVLVERIEGFCGKDAWKRAYREINEFERQLTDDGVRIVKLLVHVSEEEQKRRMIERLDDPHKHYKIGLEDFRNIAKRKQYLEAYDDMLETHRHRPCALARHRHRRQEARPAEGPEDRRRASRQGHRQLTEQPARSRRSPKRPTSCGAGSRATRRRTSTTNGPRYAHSPGRPNQFGSTERLAVAGCPVLPSFPA